MDGCVDIDLETFKKQRALNTGLDLMIDQSHRIVTLCHENESDSAPSDCSSLLDSLPSNQSLLRRLRLMCSVFYSLMAHLHLCIFEGGR